MRIAILTGGGDCPGLNQAIRGAFYRGKKLGYEFIGILEGWKGAIDLKYKELKLEDVEGIMYEGGTILGTSRTNPYKNEADAKKVVENLKKIDAYALIAIGGDDTLGVANKLYKDFKLNVVGVPKTMDNDLSGTDYTFGFDSATTVAIDAAKRLIDTGKSHRRIMVLEVMGREAGWVALFTGIASGADYICIPEEEIDIKKMCEHLKNTYNRKGYALVVVSEAINVEGQKDVELTDAFGHKILKEKGTAKTIAEIIEKETGIETRYAVIGHIQRGGSPTLFDKMLALRAGVHAVDLIHNKKFGRMVAIRGDKMIDIPLEEAVGKNKLVDKEWIEFKNNFI
ncbi:MAG: ATP-dependent 6-phosphofructokinase [bacterium]|nr:ATP-dependent 6-phosphofructokinase [bacterium]